MSKLRVYEVARDLAMDNKSLVALFQSVGVTDVRNHMSAVLPEQGRRRGVDRRDRDEQQLGRGEVVLELSRDVLRHLQRLDRSSCVRRGADRGAARGRQLLQLGVDGSADR